MCTLAAFTIRDFDFVLKKNFKLILEHSWDQISYFGVGDADWGISFKGDHKKFTATSVNYNRIFLPFLLDAEKL